jgi:hypothetical protein
MRPPTGPEGDGSAKFANASDNAGSGGKATPKNATDQKINPKAVYEWVVVRWFSTEAKAADVEKSLKDKPWVKGMHTHPADQVVCVNYYGERKDMGVVRSTVAGGNSIILSPCKVGFSFKLAKGVKEGDPKKLREKVGALRGIVHTEALSGTSATFYLDPSKFEWAKLAEVCKAEGFDYESTTHDIITIGFDWTKEGQSTADLTKALVKQKGTLIVLEANDWKKYVTLLTERDAVKDDVIKKMVETAGLKPTEIKRQK